MGDTYEKKFVVLLIISLISCAGCASSSKESTTSPNAQQNNANEQTKLTEEEVKLPDNQMDTCLTSFEDAKGQFCMVYGSTNSAMDMKMATYLPDKQWDIKSDMFSKFAEVLQGYTKISEAGDMQVPSINNMNYVSASNELFVVVSIMKYDKTSGGNEATVNMEKYTFYCINIETGETRELPIDVSQFINEKQSDFDTDYLDYVYMFNNGKVYASKINANKYCVYDSGTGQQIDRARDANFTDEQNNHIIFGPDEFITYDSQRQEFIVKDLIEGNELTTMPHECPVKSDYYDWEGYVTSDGEVYIADKSGIYRSDDYKSEFVNIGKSNKLEDTYNVSIDDLVVTSGTVNILYYDTAEHNKDIQRLLMRRYL